MKNFLMLCAAIGILGTSASVSYYFLVTLPQQNTQMQQDLSAIRSAVAPTPEQMQEQTQRAQEQVNNMNASLQQNLRAWLK